MDDIDYPSGLDARAVRALSELSINGDDPLIELFGVYLQDLPVQLKGLRDALKAGNGEEAGMFAHRLAGAGGNLGGLRFAELLRKVEHLAVAGQLKEATARMRAVDEESAVVKAAMEAYLKKKG